MFLECIFLHIVRRLATIVGCKESGSVLETEPDAHCIWTCSFVGTEWLCSLPIVLCLFIPRLFNVFCLSCFTRTYNKQVGQWYNDLISLDFCDKLVFLVVLFEQCFPLKIRLPFSALETLILFVKIGLLIQGSTQCRKSQGLTWQVAVFMFDFQEDRLNVVQLW